jgi:hypothetical protein
LRALLVVGGFVVATPGGGIMPLYTGADHAVGARHPRANGFDRNVPGPTPNAGAEPVARAVTAVHNGGDES